MLTKGPGFVLWDNLYDQKDLDDAGEYIHNYVHESKEEDIDAGTVSEEVGHDNIYANTKEGEVDTQGKRVWNLCNKG